MNKTTIYDNVTSLLDDFEMPQAQFDFFLDTAQAYWEGQRPWMVLRSENTDVTIGANNTFETQNSLPSNFMKWYTRFSIVLCDSNGNPQQYLKECALNQKTMYKGNSSRFYCIYRTNKFYVCGSPAQSLVARIYYVQHGTKISAADANTWDLDPQDRFTQILAFTIAAYFKLGVDYDVINNRQGDANADVANQVYKLMEDWDAELQESSLDEGAPQGSAGGYFGADGLSGQLSMLR